MRSLLFFLVFLISMNGWAQQRWNAEFRPSLSFPTMDVADYDLRPGYGADLLLAYKIMPHLRLSGGWGMHVFTNDHEEGEPEIEIRETSFLMGFELRLPISEKPLHYLVYAGGIVGQIKVEDQTLMIDSRSDYKLGGEIGAAVEYWLDDTWSLKPLLRYRLLNGNRGSGNDQIDAKLRYLALSVGLSYSF